MLKQSVFCFKHYGTCTTN